MPPCLPIPIFSIIRKFLVAISKYSWNVPVISFPFRSLAFPTFGYTFAGWRTARLAFSETNLDPTDSVEHRSSHAEPNGSIRPPDLEKAPPEFHYSPNSSMSHLMNNPTLFDPLRKPRNPIVLCHGLYGFDVRGFEALPGLRIHYWSEVLRVLRREIGADVVVTRVPPTGAVVERAERLHENLKENASGRTVNLIGHSMGGLDGRYLISKIQPKEYHPASLITLSTPHRGSPFMDWLMQYIGLGTPRNTNFKMVEPTVPIPSSIISLIDSPAYSNLTSTYMEEEFNPKVPDLPSVKYWSVAARTNTMSFFHPLWLPKLIVDSFQEKQRQQPVDSAQSARIDWGNDGLVTVQSAKWGDFLGVLEECDHWDVRGAGGFNGHVEWGSEMESTSKWSWSDWQSFLRDWRKGRENEQTAQDTRTEKVATRILEKKSGFSKKEKDDLIKNPGAMFAVLDWVVDNVPGVNAVSSPLSMVMKKASALTPKDGHDKPKPPNFDIERFYVALCRKLYDEGM